MYIYIYTHLTYNLCNMPIRKAPTPADDDWKFHVCQEFTFCHEGLLCIWLLIAWVVESMQLSQVRYLPQHLWLMLRPPQWRLRCPQLRLRCPGGPGLAVFLGFFGFWAQDANKRFNLKRKREVQNLPMQKKV